jgi:hypothetical protein
MVIPPSQLSNPTEPRLSNKHLPVHYAGNLQIAASFFLTLGLVFVLSLTLITLLVGLAPGQTYSTSTGEIDLPENEICKNPDCSHGPHAHHRDHKPSHHVQNSKPIYSHPRYSPFTPVIVTLTLTCLYVGILCQILAQLFGLLGLNVLATPGSIATASDLNQGIPAAVANYGLGPWVVDRGLSTWATVAWTSAVACAALVGNLWQRPRWARII